MAWRVKKWEIYQHFTRRRPTWIKLHHGTLDDREFHEMSDRARATLPMIWLLTSEYKAAGVLPLTLADVAHRLRRTVEWLAPIMEELCQAKFLKEVHGAADLAADKTDLLDNGVNGKNPADESPQAEFPNFEPVSDWEDTEIPPIESNVGKKHAQSQSQRQRQRESQSQSLSSSKQEIERIIGAYNDRARPSGRTNWPTCQTVTAKRKRLLDAIARDHGIGEWEAMLERAAASSFLNGTAPRGKGHANWKADIEFLARPDIFAQVVEGKHDDETPKSHHVAKPNPRLAAARAGVAAGIARRSS